MVAALPGREDRGPAKVVGRYALYGEIAAGGMATVHIGRLLGPVGFARTVAIKRLHPQFAKDPEFVSMFLDEARLAARVQHPNVVATIDVVATDGELFLIMDYVRGESLAKLVRQTVKRDEYVPSKIIASIMCGFLHGLHAAHEAKNERGEPLNLVHRDVSPQNVLVGSDGVARVLDFGVAKAAGRIQVTREGQVKGKLAYMPPEQLAGSPTLTRTVDIYASAVVLWEAITGERLFKGESEGETLHKILRGNIEAPSARVPDLPPGFDEVCLRALSRDPLKRYGTAREMALALERCEGIASPTDVGEWVERMAGNTLIDRETRIAEIESNSAGVAMHPSGNNFQAARSDSPSAPLSDSDVSRPIPPGGISRPKIEATFVGVGPPSDSRMPTSDRSGQTEILAPASHRAQKPQRKRSSSLSDSDVRRPSGLTGLTRLMTLPLEKRLPYVLIGGACLVLLIVLVVGIVVARFSQQDEAKLGISPTPSTTAAPNVQNIPPVPQLPLSADPADSASAENDPPKQDPSAKPDTTPMTFASTPPQLLPPPVQHPVTHPTATQHAQNTTTQNSPPIKKTNCDPPYTIDSKGHKHYKVECN